MEKKVFISYSHKDEQYRSDLEDHLSMLKRNGVISIWHDRKIIAGDDWKNKISENLEASEIILLLISPSFLASDYCYDIELNRAIEKHENGSARIFSIIIRPCDWQNSQFAKYQAVPKDGEPIVLWKNTDSAWLDAIKSLKTLIQEFSPDSPKKICNTG